MYDAVFLPAWDDKFFAGCGFWVAALLWLPAGVVAQALIRFAPGLVDAPGPGLFDLLMGPGSLVFVAPCGLPLALGCRRVWQLGYRRGGGGPGSGSARPPWQRRWWRGCSALSRSWPVR